MLQGVWILAMDKIADQPDEHIGYVMNGVILRPHWADNSNPSMTTAGWSGWMRFDSGEDIGTRPHDDKVLGIMDGNMAFVASPDLTSRD